MNIADFLMEDNVFTALNTSYENTSAFYNDFALFLQERKLITDPQRIKRLFIKRESLQSTGIGRGAAAPHIYSDEFGQFLFALAFIRRGIDFRAQDRKPVHLIFLLMSSEEEVGLHLKLLARVARLVRDTDVAEASVKAADGKEVLGLVLDREKRLD